MIISKKVYDITLFLEYHPGGKEELLPYMGKDGTQGFSNLYNKV